MNDQTNAISCLSEKFYSLSLSGAKEQDHGQGEASNSIDNLPIEILLKIAFDTDLSTIQSMAQSSRRFRAFVKDNAREIFNALTKRQLATLGAEGMFAMRYSKKTKGYYVPHPHIFCILKGIIKPNPDIYEEEIDYTTYAPLFLPGPGFLYMLEKHHVEIELYAIRIRRALSHQVAARAKVMEGNDPASTSYKWSEKILKWSTLVIEEAKAWAQTVVLDPTVYEIKGPYPKIKELVWYYGAPSPRSVVGH